MTDFEKDLKRQIDNLANKLNKRIQQYTKLDKIIPEVKHVFDLLEDGFFSKFTKNGKFKRGVSDLTLNEQIEYLDQLEQAEQYTPTRTEAQKIIDTEKEEIQKALKRKLRYKDLSTTGEIWGYIKDNIPDITHFLSSTEIDQSIDFMDKNNSRNEIENNINEIGDLLQDDEISEDKKRIKISDILLKEQERLG